MSDHIYDGRLLIGDTAAVAELGIDVRGKPDVELPLERLALSLDPRIPQKAIGYVSDLCHDRATRSLKLDRIRMLSRYVEIVLP